MTTTYDFHNLTILITGANRGLGRALVDEALRRGFGLVYAGTRRPFAHPDDRVVPLLVDLADPHSIEAAAATIEHLDILVNNAGAGGSGEDIADGTLLSQRLQVNAIGPAVLTGKLVPALRRSRGRVVNIGSLAAVANLPVMAAHSISKAAALSLTQGQRALLRGDGIGVHLVLAGPIDTDMSRDLDIDKADPESVAASIFDAIASGEPDIFPDPMSAALADAWSSGLNKTLETANAELLPADYRIEFVTAVTLADCFRAISKPEGWWDGEVVGSADHQGAEFAYSHGGMHRSVQRVIDYVPESRIVWEVVASELGFVDESEPWTGTTIVFDLAEVDGRTRVTMTHRGLTPERDCYDQCSLGWDHVIGRSLRQFMTTGDLVPF